eukprot:GHRR01028407.1.p1 GENE.GHRR01028407.1~~GHRR01028407.1.p1  ORF type:complete len:152 (-),score=40.47 GHRR01028407.1:655-1110(-)
MPVPCCCCCSVAPQPHVRWDPDTPHRAVRGTKAENAERSGRKAQSSSPTGNSEAGDQGAGEKQDRVAVQDCADFKRTDMSQYDFFKGYGRLRMQHPSAYAFQHTHKFGPLSMFQAEGSNGCGMADISGKPALQAFAGFIQGIIGSTLIIVS